MFQTNTHWMIKDLVVSLFDGKDSPKNRALYFGFDVRCREYSQDYVDSCSVHFLFIRPYGSMGFGTTYTFAAITDNCFDNWSKVKSWEFLSSHDSCWADAVNSYLNKIYFDMAKRSGIDIAPKDFSWSVNFNHSRNNRCFDWLNVTMEKDPIDQHGYKKTIKINGEF